ncbi:hypothetical protein GcC1_205018 [Golovinomyces cichoracearum]|uniref:Uncharacterized protein n=1 Tax=Golovinomyces cichoracearum TaxID=62708 RepID=A0A420HCW7_9PEZI|nr:hypothetical protein GcC1_205018 [Golovinomyces cichoracearum]
MSCFNFNESLRDPQEMKGTKEIHQVDELGNFSWSMKQPDKILCLAMTKMNQERFLEIPTQVLLDVGLLNKSGVQDV